MRIRFLHMVAVLALMAVFSCRKETSVENPGGAPGTFVAEIDGVHWEATDSMKAASMLAGLINISGVSVDHKQLSITLNDTVLGVYILNQLSTSVGVYQNNDSTGQYAFASNQSSDTSLAGGRVTVTEIDRVNQTISGTFSFNAYSDPNSRAVKIREGEFLKIPYTNTLPPANTGDTMSAFIDGQPWVAASIQALVLDNQLVIGGSASSGVNAVSLFMPYDIMPGSYPLDFTGIIYFGVYFPTSSQTLVSSSGNLVIQQHDQANKKITGTFHFQAVDLLGQRQPSQFSEGYFSVQYQ